MRNVIFISTLHATAAIFFVGCQSETPSNVTDSELRQLTEELFAYENPDFQHYVQANFQGNQTQRPYSDLARQPLLTVYPVILGRPLLKYAYDLFDNYEMDTRKEEIVTPGEYDEQERFLEDLLNTPSIHRVVHFLSERGFIREGNGSYKDTLKDIWFHQFARQKKSKVRGSSGFEHVFLGELKSGQKLIGLHNWIYFHVAERTGLLDYWGHRQTRILGKSKASVATVVFSYLGKVKSSTIFIGTSPELEISLYTLCYFVRPNKYCRVAMGGTKFGVQTYAVNHTGDRPSLGTGYPVV